MDKLHKTTLLLILIGACFYWLSFQFLDQPIAYFFHQGIHKNGVYSFYSLITLLGDPRLSLCAIVLCFASAIFLFYQYPQNRLAKLLFLIGVAMILAICCEKSLKFLLGRYRPLLLFQDGLYGFHFLSDQFLLNSTPSGHATRVFVLITGFSLIWKRLTPLFILAGLLVCLSRLALEFHFLSDVFFGALLGSLITLWTFKRYTAQSAQTDAFDPF